MRRILAMGAAAMVLAGCSGTSPEKLAALQSGRTTVPEAVAALGSPDRDETLPDGSRMLTYVAQSSHTRPVNFVPAANLAWGGWDVKTGEAALMFGPDGRLRFHSWSGDERRTMRSVGQASSPYAVKPAEPPTAPAPEQAIPDSSGQSPAN